MKLTVIQAGDEDFEAKHAILTETLAEDPEPFIQPEYAADLMEAALAVDDSEPLPPGSELDRKVAEALGVEATGWRPASSIYNVWNPLRFPPLKVGGVKIEYRFPAYSTDPAASDEARRLAFEKGLGWAVELRYETGGFKCYLQEIPEEIGDPDETEQFGGDGAYVLFFTENSNPPIGETAQHARALAIVATRGSP